MQFMAQTLGGEVKHADHREFGKTKTVVDTTSPLFKGLSKEEIVWMSHQDYVAALPDGFSIVAHSENCPVAAMQNVEKNSMPCSIILKYSIRNMAKKCFITSSLKYAIVQARGPWPTMLNCYSIY